jgi:CheY-like chemotaxis protein
MVSAEPAADSAPQARIRFAICDTGVGISQENQARLFEPFRQVDDSDTRRHGGTGLGLAISLQLVELMGGTIGLESKPGHGYTFHFVLDLPTVAAPALQTAAASPRERDNLTGRILLVEDNAVNREIALVMLEELGVSVCTAGDGSEALARATQERFDLILMDCQLPEMDGFEATRRIRAHALASNLPHVPIVALTANAIRGDRERCIDAGMDDYLSKPFRREDLHGAIRRWLAAQSDRPTAIQQAETAVVRGKADASES